MKGQKQFCRILIFFTGYLSSYRDFLRCGFDLCCRASNTTPQQPRRFPVERLNNENVTTIYRHELEAELSGALVREPLSLDVKLKLIEEIVRKLETNTIGYTQKQAGKAWFDDVCARVCHKKTNENSKK
jgi:hypothetical protein